MVKHEAPIDWEVRVRVRVTVRLRVGVSVTVRVSFGKHEVPIS